MWTAEETQQYVADFLSIPAEDLIRATPPDLPSDFYCFGQLSTGAIHSVMFPHDQSEPVITTQPVDAARKVAS